MLSTAGSFMPELDEPLQIDDIINALPQMKDVDVGDIFFVHEFVSLFSCSHGRMLIVG